MVGKSLNKDAHTVLAAGGINAALGTVDPEDSLAAALRRHAQGGLFPLRPSGGGDHGREALAAINELVEYGCPSQEPKGRARPALLRGAQVPPHLLRGRLHGAGRCSTLVDKVDSLTFPSTRTVRLAGCWSTTAGASGPSPSIQLGERTVYLADAVVLATGGHTRLWRVSSSRRDENTGDGMYLALEAGCRLSDMELVQFHPTGMVYPEEWAGTLVTEAVRGEGGRLYNNDGERYMERYDPKRLELSTRDRVALANYTEISEGRGTEHGASSWTSPTAPRSTSWRSCPACTASSSRPRCWTSPRAHGGRADGPLLYGRRRRRAGDARHRRWRASTRSGRSRRGCTGRTASGATRSPRRWSLVGAPARRRPRSRPRDATCNCAPERQDPGGRRGTRSLIQEGDEFARPLQRPCATPCGSAAASSAASRSSRKGCRRLGEIQAAAADVDVGPPRRATVTWRTPSTCAARSSSPRPPSSGPSSAGRPAGPITVPTPEFAPDLNVN